MLERLAGRALAAALPLATLRNVVVVVALGLAVTTCHARDAALKRAGAAEVRAAVADSLLALNAARLARVDTQVVRDIRTVKQLVARVDTIKTFVVDTLFATEDSARVTPLVVIPAGTFTFFTDTLAPKCNALAKDCEQFRADATERFRLYEARLNSNATSVCPSRVPSAGLAFGAGYAAGFATAKRF